MASKRLGPLPRLGGPPWAVAVAGREGKALPSSQLALVIPVAAEDEGRCLGRGRVAQGHSGRAHRRRAGRRRCGERTPPRPYSAGGAHGRQT